MDEMKLVGEITGITGNLYEFAIITWRKGQPPIGTKLYAAAQPPTPYRSTPGLSESSDSPNGAHIMRQPCETGSGGMAVAAAPIAKKAKENRELL